MPALIRDTILTEPLAARLAELRQAGTVQVHWLGQAGFVVTANGWRVLIDPYLSDSLAEKYAATPTPHDRMMPLPVTPDELGPVDLVLVTHYHTDHMDPATLQPLAARQPALRFVVPLASLAEADRRIGVAADRLIPMDAGEGAQPLPGLRITALRAAHETLERDAQGRHVFLGYAFRIALPGGAVTIIHSGDTIPFPGQVEELALHRPDLLLLPVNGRSPALQARGIAGNLTLEEAGALAAAVGAAAGKSAPMVAHHHGMFAFNTRDIGDINCYAIDPATPVRVIPARPGLELGIELA